MKNSEGRAYRRAQVARIKKARKSYFSYWTPSAVRLGKLVHTAKACSCYMCGNPRRYWEEDTIQEQRFDERCIYENVELFTQKDLDV